MLILRILEWFFGSLLFISVVGGVIAYFTLAVPAMKNAQSLSEGDRHICEQLIQEGKGYPWVCRKAVKQGACPCQPCAKVAKRKGPESI
jgi:hypothetical protein